MGMPGGGPGPTQKYSNLDLIKAETPHTPTKISRMLHQLEFKLQVEMQYKAGIDKMAKLYQADGDKKSRADAESKKVESEKKIQLLQTALKRYKNLHILDEVVEEEEPSKRGAFCALT
jgi:classical protein kinase C